MKKAALLLAAVVAGAAAIAPHAVAAPARKAGTAAPADWSKRVAVTPEGGFLMGNPAARVKVVEYGSLTCPHCASFTNSAKAALAARVRTGKVSFEFRNFVLNGIDVAATLVARCGGPSRFFPLTERLYATQEAWVGKITGLPQAQQQSLQAMSDAQRLVKLAELGGMTQLAAQGGVAPAQTQACLSHPAGLQRLVQMAEAAEAQGVHGTPTFFINGAQAPVNDWPGIEALIVKAGG